MIDTDTMNRFNHQAEMLANRVKKRFKHFSKRFSRENIDVFRLYDWDIPEIRAVVDWYAGHLVIAEYERKQTVPEWLPMMGEAVASAMNISIANIHLKRRRAGKKDGSRYNRLDDTNQTMVVSERDLRFYVNLNDFVDTGLFSDHRNTRQMIREMANEKKFLNLYCYTATFSCYAAKGGARRTVSVDRSETAMQWARHNFQINNISEENHRLVQADTFDFLKKAKRCNEVFDLALVDPPSFSTTRIRTYMFDIAKDHLKLLLQTLPLMRSGGIVFFSTNHQDFELQIRRLDVTDIHEITDATIPEDYMRKRQPVHRCWRINV